MRNKTVLLALLSVLLAALLAGCVGDVSLTPENAVMSNFTKFLSSADISADQNSLQVLQSQKLGDNYLVLASFQGKHNKTGDQNCLYTYLVTRVMGGWVISSGDGSCANPPADPSKQAVTVASKMGKDGKDDPGYSSIGGQVWYRYIKVVRVTWSDGKVEQPAINNNSFFTIRSGQFSYTKVEALNEMNQILYTYIPTAAQGK